MMSTTLGDISSRTAVRTPTGNRPGSRQYYDIIVLCFTCSISQICKLRVTHVPHIPISLARILTLHLYSDVSICIFICSQRKKKKNSRNNAISAVPILSRWNFANNVRSKNVGMVYLLFSHKYSDPDSEIVVDSTPLRREKHVIVVAISKKKFTQFSA